MYNGTGAAFWQIVPIASRFGFNSLVGGYGIYQVSYCVMKVHPLLDTTPPPSRGNVAIFAKISAVYLGISPKDLGWRNVYEPNSD